MHKKQLYEAPDAELLVIRYEENFCQTGGTTNPSTFGDGGADLDDESDEDWWGN